VGMCLSEALHYAHERGIIHLDLKPSNILLAADGQPMLLDFHLSREPLRVNGPRPDSFGGTPRYMSPEQRQALAVLRAGAPFPPEVDATSDIYSLGLVLYETLAGVLPSSAAPKRLDHLNRQVSPGLANLVNKCLAQDPA